MINLQQATFIEISAEVRYWEDAEINGKEDTDGKMPLRQNKLWKPIIELKTGKVPNWPIGTDAKIHYKVCDQGEYWLLNQDKNRIGKWKGFYVPNNILCINDSGFGDYIIFNINNEGQIENWKEPFLNSEDWE